VANSSSSYPVREDKSSSEYRFFFLSKGVKVVVKAVQYTYAYKYEDREVYNLGFGDYDHRLDQIKDGIYSNSGDAYKVFATVLSTIPLFFRKFNDDILMVLGSDGGSDFVANCQKTCVKKCSSSCRKFNQRITIYRNYVEKNYSELSRSYWFLGGYLTINNQIVTERYILGRKYDAILMFQK
jgi:hypothetical protein